MQNQKQQKQQKHHDHDLAALLVSFEEHKRRRTYQENTITRLKKSVLDKYSRVANTKRRMQYYESWHDSTDISSEYPMELTDCYKLSTATSSFESLKIIRLKDNHIIHEFVRKLRKSDIACTVIHNFENCKLFHPIESIIIKSFIQSLYPSHSQLFDNIIQPLFIELIESLKNNNNNNGIMNKLYNILHPSYFLTYFGNNSSSNNRGTFVLKLIYKLIHHRITHIMFAPLHRIIIKLAQGDLIFNKKRNAYNMYSLLSLAIDSIYCCDYSILLDIFATIFDCLHFSLLELSHKQCIQIINYIIWKWIIFKIINEPHRYGFRISYLTKWQTVSCSLFINILNNILMNDIDTNTNTNNNNNNYSEYDLTNDQILKLNKKISKYIQLFSEKLQKFVSFQAKEQAKNTTSSSENVSSYSKIHEYNFGILHNWSFLSSIELRVLHCILFSDSSSLSSSQIRSLEKFHKISFESLDPISISTRISPKNIFKSKHNTSPSSTQSAPITKAHTLVAELKTNDDNSVSVSISTDDVSSDVDSLDLLAQNLVSSILNSSYHNSYLFIIGVYPFSDIYLQWKFISSSSLLETSSLENLSKICIKNIQYLSSLSIHIRKAPHLFATWTHSLLKLLLNTHNPLPRNRMICNQLLFDGCDDDDEDQDDFVSLLNYLEYRDIRNPSLLYGLSSAISAQSSSHSSIYFGLCELYNIYPLKSLNISSILKWLSLCLTEASSLNESWYLNSIKSLHSVLFQLSQIDRIYRIRIDHLKHCLFSTKLYYFTQNTEILFHRRIPIPNIIFNNDGIIIENQNNKLIFDFWSNSIPEFINKILINLHNLSKLQRIIPILFRKYLNVISVCICDHSPAGNFDHNMLRSIHHLICISLYYILNEPLWMCDDKLNHSLEILNKFDLNPYNDLGLNNNIQINIKQWKWCGNQLNNLEYHITPSTKIQCIHEIMQSLTHHLHSHLRYRKSIQLNQIKLNNLNKKFKNTSKNTNHITVGADDIFPSLIWLIIISKPKYLSSSLSLIEHVNDSPKTGVHAYSFTLFKQAITYIQQLANEKTKINKIK